MSQNEYDRIAEDIRVRRQLPYTLTVEKVEGDKIYTHNIWGNAVIYKSTTKAGDEESTTYEIFKE